LKLIERFNRTSNWIASEILLTANPKQRITVLERCISLIKSLRDLKNFHGAWTIYSALNKSCIQGLKAEWKGVSRKYIHILHSIDELMDGRGNFKNYRETIKNVEPPFLPFEGIFLTDITFLDENPDFVSDGMVNFKKVKFLGDILATIRKIQQMESHPFQESLLLKEYMKRAIVLDEQHLHQVSTQIASVQITSDKKKILHPGRIRTYSK
jgi:Ras-specific guanine nucleotide-releasing factor 2